MQLLTILLYSRGLLLAKCRRNGLKILDEVLFNPSYWTKTERPVLQVGSYSNAEHCNCDIRDNHPKWLYFFEEGRAQIELTKL